MAGGFDAAVYAWVRCVPRGRVVSYGQVATALGSPRAARAVGYALFRCVGHDIPWHRVVNARGEVSMGGDLHRPDLQRRLLEEEGVRFDTQGRIDWAVFGFDGSTLPTHYRVRHRLSRP